MKRYLILILLLILSLGASAQGLTPIGSKNSALEVLGGNIVDSFFKLPQTYATHFTNIDSAGRMWYSPIAKTIYFNDGTSRRKISSSDSNLYIGQTVTGGTNNGVLYTNASGKLGNSAYFTYQGGHFSVGYDGTHLMFYNDAASGTYRWGDIGSSATGTRIEIDASTGHQLIKHIGTSGEVDVNMSNINAIRVRTEPNQNGMYALTSDIQHQYIFKLASINMATPGAVTIGTTTDTLGRFIITSIKYVVKTFSGTISVAPQVSIGVTGAGYTDIVNTATLPSSPTVNNPTSFTVLSTALSVNVSTEIVFRVSTGAVFSVPGEYAIDVYVQGYYETL